MKQQFIDKKFSPRSMALLDLMETILDRYQAGGYTLTVRQLYYQLVAMAAIPNSIKSYKRIVGLTGDGRLTGLINWWHIEDRNRSTVGNVHWKDPSEKIKEVAFGYAIDKREDQSNYLTVMVEKDALSGVISPVCSRLDISYTANKGYCSLSTLYSMGQRMQKERKEGKEIHVLYLGDHDPSGIDMTRDVFERLTMFSGGRVNVHRLALNRSQIDRLNPPENPAKTKDSRFKKYALRHGLSSWELDAVDPHELDRLITNAVNHFTDQAKWKAAVVREEEGQAELDFFVAAYKKARLKGPIGKSK